MTEADGAVAVWREVELELRLDGRWTNAYTDVDVFAEFRHESGELLIRPAFWDGGNSWRVRFAAPGTTGTWTWRAVAPKGISVEPASGSFDVTGHPADEPLEFYRSGFWRMSEGGRNVVHPNGAPDLIAADTAWALPWRATLPDVETYARDRSGKGFNAVLLMSVQPDMDARGPRERTLPGGFDVGFEDLREGRLEQVNIDYFRTLDAIVATLRRHGIVPVLQPVFHGFGWKGLRAAGPLVPPADYARYCRFLVARYGAGPAIYLVGADGAGTEPQIEAGGREVEEWDAYGQPCGIHYRPHARNDAHQDAHWLDFQWSQTGHGGEHVPERVADQWRNLPAKGVANGEPSYENTGRTGLASGWWQGHEAWSNLCAGGTMGVFYGAGSLWQWKLAADEAGHSDFFSAPGAGWREALDFEGSAYVGLVRTVLAGLPFTDMAPDWTQAIQRRALTVPGRLAIFYNEMGGPVLLAEDNDIPLPYRVVDPRTGAQLAEGHRRPEDRVIPHDGEGPAVFICQVAS
ncbi:apiosidase-like domain-containing protein [Occultella gossypii]|uniref:DUF4038 domain-containing protein n=1 Tax=Occultella gossypii TaxID=2800820 RepID=A0ABS7SBY0_9MICO|nr:DUF4038 domain-containing protein [Occultella gossypii]MBZ2197868.1 DUF4038 domain-containing protein [Occultella gossypii]